MKRAKIPDWFGRAQTLMLELNDEGWSYEEKAAIAALMLFCETLAIEEKGRSRKRTKAVLRAISLTPLCAEEPAVIN